MKFRGRLGPNEEDDKCVRILSRVVEWNDEGIAYEADQRHAEIIEAQLGLRNSVKTLTTPGKREEAEGDDMELNSEDATKYRALTARAKYLAQDRSDIQFAVTSYAGRRLIRGQGIGRRLND